MTNTYKKLFILKLFAKAFQEQGKTMLAMSANDTSRECFLCGRINQGLTLKDRVFHCPPVVSLWIGTLTLL